MVAGGRCREWPTARRTTWPQPTAARRRWRHPTAALPEARLAAVRRHGDTDPDWEDGPVSDATWSSSGRPGSIGTQALDLVRANPDRFRVVGLTAGGGNPELFAAARSPSSRPAFSGLGEDASPRRPATPCDVVLNGITGAVGLRPTLAALDAGTTLALANKESPDHGRPAGARPGEARARSCRSTPSTARWPSACAAAPADGGTPPGADRERRPVPRPHPRASSRA